MKTTLLSLVILVTILSCGEKNTNQSSTDEKDTLSLSDPELETWIASAEGETLNLSQVPKLETVAAKDGQEQSQIAELSNTDVPVCTNLPTAISGLNSGASFEVYKFTSDASAGASAMGFSGSIGKKELLIIRDYVRYSIVDCGGTKKKYGVGLRCFIHVKSIKSKLTGSFANIAAAAQLDQGSATYSLKSLGFGMEGDMLAEELDGQGDYNVDNFGKLAITFNNVLKTLKGGNGTLAISPVELPMK